jgi:FAD/FMN-containing dehydrogenase
VTRAPTPAERSLHGEDVEVRSPRDAAELADVVRAAEAAGRRIVPAGRGTHPEAADAPRAAAGTPWLVSAERFDGVVSYEPDDFTIGVGAGMPLPVLREILLRHRQEIPHDAPRAAGGTAGGLVARAPWSPRQGSAGPLHALVLGAEGVRGGGRPFRAGGMVVKNVAGYQIHKVVVGSFGTLGVLTRINFRVRPVPEVRHAAVAAVPTPSRAAELVAALRARRLEPACLVVLAEPPGDASPPGLPWPEGTLRVAWMFEGNAARVRWLAAEARRVAAEGSLRAEESDDAGAADALRDRLALVEEPPSDRAAGIARVSVLPTDAARAQEDLARRLAGRRGLRATLLADALTGQVVARWEGDAPLDAPLADVADAASRFAGCARLVHLPGALRARHRRDLGPDPNAELAARVRAAFDPRGTFEGAAA